MHDLTVKVFSAVVGALAAALLERTVTQVFSAAAARSPCDNERAGKKGEPTAFGQGWRS
jgi:hypothetical protein